ncbi:ALQxL family class IV lanthipeptide [Streptomyces sp. NPDC089919]
MEIDLDALQLLPAPETQAVERCCTTCCVSCPATCEASGA